MTRHGIPLGRIWGILIGLDYSWFVIFALLIWMLGGSDDDTIGGYVTSLLRRMPKTDSSSVLIRPRSWT